MPSPITGVDDNDEDEAKLLIALNQELLDSIANLDYETYDRLCADDMSCMEPESNQNVVIGKEFHKYYFDVFGGGSSSKIQTNVTMVQRPHVQFLGSNSDGKPTGAVLSYVKLTQQTEPGKSPVTIQQSETRVWEKQQNERWVNIHFHKSAYRS
mmetsp:Transcript_1741/g.3884  ORF Transcript_1741/g.3884 Transcript_1741/m.3884 type:complete len:154 (+) Transcript_1741:107-568(+)